MSFVRMFLNQLTVKLVKNQENLLIGGPIRWPKWWRQSKAKETNYKCRTKTNLSSRIVEWFRILRIFLWAQLIELEAQYCRQRHELFLMGNNMIADEISVTTWKSRPNNIFILHPIMGWVPTVRWRAIQSRIKTSDLYIGTGIIKTVGQVSL